MRSKVQHSARSIFKHLIVYLLQADYYKDQLYVQGLALMLRRPEDPESETTSLSSEETVAENDQPIKGRSLAWLKSPIKSPSRDLEAEVQSSGTLAGGYGATSNSSGPLNKAALMLNPVSVGGLLQRRSCPELTCLSRNIGRCMLLALLLKGYAARKGMKRRERG